MKIKSSVIRDTIELVDETGKTIKEIPFAVNVAKIANEVVNFRNEIGKNANDPETVGETVVKLFYLIFGETTTDELLAHYENDYATMLADISPIITDVIYPAVDRVRGKYIDIRKHTKRG